MLANISCKLEGIEIFEGILEESKNGIESAGGGVKERDGLYASSFPEARSI